MVRDLEKGCSSTMSGHFKIQLGGRLSAMNGQWGSGVSPPLFALAISILSLSTLRWLAALDTPDTLGIENTLEIKLIG